LALNLWLHRGGKLTKRLRRTNKRSAFLVRFRCAFKVFKLSWVAGLLAT
jgi:hypothetical protein